jgi:hypothetical protein
MYTHKETYYTPLHTSPDMHDVKHKLVKNTLPSHHVKQDDTRVPPNCRRAEKQVVSRHPGWSDLSLKRVLSVEKVELLRLGYVLVPTAPVTRVARVGN